jgi:hypothetical protein
MVQQWTHISYKIKIKWVHVKKNALWDQPGDLDGEVFRILQCPFSQCLRSMLYLMNACQLDRDRHIPLIRFTVGFGVLILQGLCFFIRATNHEFVNQSMSSSVTWQLNHKARVDTPGYATGKEQSDHQTCQSPLHHLHTQCLSKDWWILWDQICLTYNLSPFFKGIF